MNKIEPIEPLFFEQSKVNYLMHNKNELKLGIKLHNSDDENKYELFESLEINNIKFRLKIAIYNKEEFIWTMNKSLYFNSLNDIIFYKILL